MRDELTGLLEIFHKIEEAGGNTPLSLSPPPWEWPRPSLRLCRPPGSTASTASSSPPAPGNQAAGRRRRRNRGAAARARRNQQAATSQVTLAEVVPPPRLPPTPPCRPLRHLLSPTPTSGRRRVMSLGGRRCPPSPPSTWTDPPLLLLLHHLPHHHLHGYAMMTARTTSTAATAESVLSFVMITLAVTAMVKKAWASVFIVQCAVVEEAWNIKIANWRTSCRQRLIIQQAIPTICDIFLVIFIISSIIQCSMIFTRMLSLISVIGIDKKYRKWEKIMVWGSVSQPPMGVCPNPPSSWSSAEEGVGTHVSQPRWW